MSTPKFQLWALGAPVEKHTITAHGVDVMTRNIVGYRFATTKEEAVGHFVLMAQEKNKGFSIGEVVAIEIPEDQLVHHVEAEHPSVSSAQAKAAREQLADFLKDVTDAAFGPDQSAGKSPTLVIQQIHALRGHWLKSGAVTPPGPITKTRVFRDLNDGEEIQVGDEYCSASDGKWYPVTLAAVGLRYRPHPTEPDGEHHSPHRRQLKAP